MTKNKYRGNYKSGDCIVVGTNEKEDDDDDNDDDKVEILLQRLGMVSGALLSYVTFIYFQEII